jgi:ADP-heptose:LPS heptosyltransferase
VGTEKTALVTAASGLGDVLRITPLIRICAQLGYQVDVMIVADYPETARLLEGAPEIHRVFSHTSRWMGQTATPTQTRLQQTYDVATFTYWSSSLRRSILAERSFAFDTRRWLAEGDTTCVATIARDLGWRGKLPPPFAMRSMRSFDLSPGTIALHPGCKPDWPWKKWHGFADLARLLPEVVVIGTASDFDNSKTYFAKSFDWPIHVKNFAGDLNLPDTAALLSECTALISNDSGMMHLAVALGIPTFGIFGITSPLRESMQADNMFPVTKGLPCELACHRGTWGRRDCQHHLLCLKSLTAPEVLEKVRARVPLVSVDSLSLSSRC